MRLGTVAMESSLQSSQSKKEEAGALFEALTS